MPDEGLYSLLDFTGLPAGAPPLEEEEPLVGLLGLMDFTGLPVGQPLTVESPNVGCNLFDFTFVPCACPTVTRRGKGPKVGGKRIYAAILQQLMDREKTASAIMRDAIAIRQKEIAVQILQRMEEAELKRRRFAASYAVLLSEL